MEVKPGYKWTEAGAIPEAWLAKSLGELGKWKGGMTPSMRNPDYWLNGTIPWISSGDVKFVHLKETGYYITNEAVKHGSTTMLPAGSIVIVTRSGILRKYLPVATNLIPMAINQDIKALLPKNGLSYSFLLHAITESGPRILSQCMKAGTTVESIEFKWLKAFSLAIPPLPEQRAIATVLSDIDELLDSLNRLISKKLALKQAAMQQLLTSQTRLPGFSGKWEEMRLGDVVDIKKGQLITSSTLKQGDIPVVAGGKQPAYFHASANRFGRTITISASGASAGFVALYNEPIFASDCSTISESSNYCLDFVYFQLLNAQQTIYKAQTGGAQPHIHAKDLNPILFAYPPHSEQTEIAKVLMEMETELVGLEQQRKKSAALKQGMMQELLTGRTRLV
jgi:type I restriction enzyme S subunit